MKIHHIGIIVKDINETCNIYKKLGYSLCSEETVDQQQGIIVQFMQSSDKMQTIELIKALNANSVVKNYKLGLNHICYQTDMEDFGKYFSTLKIGKIFTKPIIAPAIDNKKVIFACLKDGSFVEFILDNGVKL